MGDQQVQYLAVKNWDKYQPKLKNGKTNKDWIKLYCDLESDPDFAMLPDGVRDFLPRCWRFVGRTGISLPYAERTLHDVLRYKDHTCRVIATWRDRAIKAGFLILCNQQRLGESALEERRGDREESNPPTPHTPSDQGGKEKDMGANWKSYFKDAFKPRQIKDRPETWTKLHELIETFTLPDVIHAFRKFLAAGYVGEYPIAAFLPVAEGLIQVGESAAPSSAHAGSQGPAKPTGPALADELARLSELDIVFGSSQRVALAILEGEFGRPDMLLAFKEFMGNLKDEKDLKFAPKNFVEQARAYVYVIRNRRQEAERNKAVLAEEERRGEEKREKMREEDAALAALIKAEEEAW